MPEKQTLDAARDDLREGKSPSTAAGEFVSEEMDHIREGKHGARSTKQAIAIGLSKARRAGVPLKPPAAGKAGEETRESAERDVKRGVNPGRAGSSSKPSATRSRATTNALKREGRSAASHEALARQARSTAKQRGPAARKRSAQKAARTRKRAA